MEGDTLTPWTGRMEGDMLTPWTGRMEGDTLTPGTGRMEGHTLTPGTGRMDTHSLPGRGDTSGDRQVGPHVCRSPEATDLPSRSALFVRS